jgi:predicted TIM-barrel fold metal-dependent hydrolase
MWIRKSRKDQLTGKNTPLPTQIISTEEYYPMPQSEDQRRVERRILELSDEYAARVGLSRRDFLRTTGGMATAFLALNEVFGKSFVVSVAEAMEPAAYREAWPKKEFIFDAQTHHVKETMVGPTFFRTLTGKLGLNPVLAAEPADKDILHRANFVKEIFFDSDTVMAIMTGAAIGPPDTYALPVQEMVNTRNLVNASSGSRRMLSHGLVVPTEPNALEEAERQVKELKIDGWKFYTGNPSGAFRMDDEKVFYPFLEKTRRLGIRNISVHKGLPLPGRFKDYYKPDDVLRAARDFPDINFIIYHSGMKNMMTAPDPGDSGIEPDGYIPWTTDLVRAREANPRLTNVYMELGTVFAHSVITHPEACGHLLGQIIRAFGSDHVLWGTDCIWWGSPQWLIEAFRRFQIPASLQEKFGYQPITPRDREKIFGLNLAKLFKVDVRAARKALPDDAFTKMKLAYENAGADPSITQYGWVRAG